jgi:hypothetical protein
MALPITLMAAQDRLIGFFALIAAKSEVSYGTTLPRRRPTGS